MKKILKIGALVSGGGTNLKAIIDACAAGIINGKMVFVGSDRADAFGITRAKEAGIPTFSIDYAGILKNRRCPAPPSDWSWDDVFNKQTLFPSKVSLSKVKAFLTRRAVAEAALLEKLSSSPFDLLVLAGFMRILTPYFIDKINTNPLNPRIMNIHPALLPAFPGTDGYGETFRYGCKVAGCTVHFVDYGEDSGPIIAQRCFPIEAHDTETTVREKGLCLEWELFPECISLFAQNRLRVARKKYVLPDGKSIQKSVVQILPKQNGCF